MKLPTIIPQFQIWQSQVTQTFKICQDFEILNSICHLSVIYFYAEKNKLHHILLCPSNTMF